MEFRPLAIDLHIHAFRDPTLAFIVRQAKDRVRCCFSH